MSPCVRVRFLFNDQRDESVLRITHLEKCGERAVAERLWEASAERLAGPRVVTQSEVATNDMFEESDRLRLDELIDHVAKDGADGEKALIGMTDVREPSLVKEDLLYDEDCYRLGKLRTGFHDAKAEGNNLGGEEEVYYGVVVILLRVRGQIRFRGDSIKEGYTP